MFLLSIWIFKMLMILSFINSILPFLFQQLEVLKTENQRLKDENGALIRVISKLSKWLRKKGRVVEEGSGGLSLKRAKESLLVSLVARFPWDGTGQGSRKGGVGTVFSLPRKRERMSGWWCVISFSRSVSLFHYVLSCLSILFRVVVQQSHPHTYTLLLIFNCEPFQCPSSKSVVGWSSEGWAGVRKRATRIIIFSWCLRVEWTLEWFHVLRWSLMLPIGVVRFEERDRHLYEILVVIVDSWVEPVYVKRHVLNFIIDSARWCVFQRRRRRKTKKSNNEFYFYC